MEYKQVKYRDPTLFSENTLNKIFMCNILCIFIQIFYNFMKFNILCFIILGSGMVLPAHSQSMQIKFCGKTANVVPTKDNNGNDQRHKGGLRMDLIRIGKLSQSRTAPFYSLGISPLSFLNGTWVDGCVNNTNATYCSGCTTCKKILSTTSSEVGTSDGKMVDNVRMRTNNNDLFIESTGTQNLVCFITNPIDVSAYAGKKLEVNVIYEGTSTEGFSTGNVNFNYRYNNGNWVNLLNQNSNFLRVIDTAILIIANVPSAVENLDGIVDFEVSPNPVHDQLHIEFNSQKALDGSIAIRDIDGRMISEDKITLQPGNSSIELNTRELLCGVYLLQVADKEGRISTKKFVKR